MSELNDKESASRVIWHVTMSVDGFIAPADESPAWMFRHGNVGPMGDEVIERTGAILAGRRGYDLGTRPAYGRRAIYGGGWAGPFFVLTHRPEHPPDGVTFLSGSIEDAVATAKAAADGGDVGAFGASIAAQCITAGLLDEIFVHLVPVLLGSGVRLFDVAAPSPQIELWKTRCDDVGQITDLAFAVRRT